MSEAEEVQFVCQLLNQPEIIDLTDDGTEERMDNTTDAGTEERMDHTTDDGTEERMDHTTDDGTEERMDHTESIECIDLTQDEPPPDIGSSTGKLQTVSQVGYKYNFPTPLLEYLDLKMLRVIIPQIQKLILMAKVVIKKESNDLLGKTPPPDEMKQKASPSSMSDIEIPLNILKRMWGEVSGTYTTQENDGSSHSAELEASMPYQSADKNIEPGIALKEKDENKKSQKNAIYESPSPRYQSDARIPKVVNEHPMPENMTRNHATQSAKRLHSPKSVNYSSKRINSEKSHGSTKEVGIVKNTVLPGISLMDPRRKAVPIGANRPLTKVSAPPSSLRKKEIPNLSVEKTNDKKMSSQPTKKIDLKTYKLLKGVRLIDPPRKESRSPEVSSPLSSISGTSSPGNSPQNVFNASQNTASTQNVGNKVTVYSDAVASNISNCPQPY